MGKGRQEAGRIRDSNIVVFCSFSLSLRCKYANDQNKMQLSCLSECGAEAHTRAVGSSEDTGALCVEMGCTRTFARNQAVTVKLKSVLISIKF